MVGKKLRIVGKYVLSMFHKFKRIRLHIYLKPEDESACPIYVNPDDRARRNGI